MKKVPGKYFWLLMTMTGALMFGAPAFVSAGQDQTLSDNSQEPDHSGEGQISKPEYLEESSDTVISNENPTDNTYGYYTIMGGTTVTADTMCSLYNEQGIPYPEEALGAGGAPDIETFCNIIIEEANAENVRGEVVFAQSMLETGWLSYGGDSEITQFNFAGLGTTGNGVKGNSFPDVRTGLRAQVQHLKAYASSEALNQECVDERFDYVTRETAPYVEWLGIQENPYGGGWAAGTSARAPRRWWTTRCCWTSPATPGCTRCGRGWTSPPCAGCSSPILTPTTFTPPSLSTAADAIPTA